MRKAFAHEAVLVMAADADTRAPGAAITVGLCGHWEHAGPCPLAAHHTQADRVGEVVQVRTLFVAEPEQEATVRDRIDAALSGGRLDGPEASTRWQVRSSHPSAVLSEEAEHARRLLRS